MPKTIRGKKCFWTHSIRPAPPWYQNQTKTPQKKKTTCQYHLWTQMQKSSKKVANWTSLVAQWLRIRLPMQGTQVQALVWEDPTCRRATKPVPHNYWAWALEPLCHNYWSPCTYSPCSATREATTMRSLPTATKSSPRFPQLEKACAQHQRPNTAKK